MSEATDIRTSVPSIDQFQPTIKCFTHTRHNILVSAVLSGDWVELRAAYVPHIPSSRTSKRTQQEAVAQANQVYKDVNGVFGRQFKSVFVPFAQEAVYVLEDRLQKLRSDANLGQTELRSAEERSRLDFLRSVGQSMVTAVQGTQPKMSIRVTRSAEPWAHGQRQEGLDEWKSELDDSSLGLSADFWIEGSSQPWSKPSHIKPTQRKPEPEKTTAGLVWVQRGSDGADIRIPIQWDIVDVSGRRQITAMQPSCPLERATSVSRPGDPAK